MKIATVFEPNEEGGFGVYFPVLSGCVSLGDSLDKARRMAREAVMDHLALLMADGNRISPKVGLPPARTPKGCAVEVLEIPAAAIHARIPAMRRSLEKARKPTLGIQVWRGAFRLSKSKKLSMTKRITP